MTDTLTFGTAPIPETRVGRNTEPNPFSDHFPTKRDADDKPAEALTVVLPGSMESNKAKVTNLTGKARRAAELKNITARVQVTEDGTGKNAKTVLTIWTIDKITRERKAKADAAK